MKSNFQTTLLFCFLSLSVFFKSEAQENTARPNFIFYLADDQDLLDYGVYGNPKVYTPAVDALAREGMRFNNFYTSQAICAPSRFQIFTEMNLVKMVVWQITWQLNPI